jgi:hypothetical protein
MLHECCVLTLLLCSGSVAVAGEHAYTCQVDHVYNLTANGALKTLPAVERIMGQSSFGVSRETGALTGNSLTLDTSLAKSTQVVNRGSKQNAFAAVADFGENVGNGTHPYQFLRVEEFREGAVKPFVVVGEVGIVVGTCK